jgi:hypothetical protein
MYTLLVVVSASVAILVWYSVRLVEWYAREPVIDYELVTPTTPDEKKILDKPSIKVGGVMMQLGQEGS